MECGFDGVFEEFQLLVDLCGRYLGPVLEFDVDEFEGRDCGLF